MINFKEAEKYAKDIYVHHFDDDVNYPDVLKAITEGVQKGVEFGYRKANEWQYGTPDTGKDLLCQTAPDEFEVGYFHPEDERFYTMDGRAIDVIAWKELVPPEVK